MAELVDAWDKVTGKRLPHRVPKHFIGHKILGPNMVSTPPAPAGGTKAAGKSANTKKED